jgi:hypothetical protein
MPTVIFLISASIGKRFWLGPGGEHLEQVNRRHPHQQHPQDGIPIESRFSSRAVQFAVHYLPFSGHCGNQILSGARVQITIGSGLTVI